MKVKDLKKLLETPEGITESEFDETIVMIGDGTHEDFYFQCPEIEQSGYTEFGGRCDEKGNELPDDGTTDKFFILAVNVFNE